MLQGCASNHIQEAAREEWRQELRASMSEPDHKTLKRAAMAEIRLVADILRHWDPIGVQPRTGAPADEYDSYAPHIVSMVKRGCTHEELAAHLERLCVENMGLGSPSSASQAHSLKFAAQILLALRATNT